MKRPQYNRNKSLVNFSQCFSDTDSIFITEKNTLHILLVEDHPLIQRLHKMILEDLNYQVTIVEDGETALAYFNPEKYNLVLMDIDLPGMNGIETTKEIRSRYPKSSIPIVALTASNNDIKLECLLSGMDDFAEKPLPRSKLEGLLSYWLSSFSASITH